MGKDTKKVSGTIDGRETSVPRGSILLRAALDLGIGVPTLCHHPGLPPDGNCRLCSAETGGRLVASCLYPLRDDGFVVQTRSPLVVEARRFVLGLLLSRAPADGYLLGLAGEYGAKADPRLADGADGCVRCGRCLRACRAAGSEAIALVGRGWGRKVAGPFYEPPIDCVGCLACAQACPTGAIAFSEEPRSIWGRDFGLARCGSCGAILGTPGELARSGVEVTLCPSCRRREYSRAVASLPPAQS